MWGYILSAVGGCIIGNVILLITIAIFSANKPDEMFDSYRQGYEKGFEDGSKPQTHTK